MNRPVCRCGKPCVAVGSRPDAALRIRYLGCRVCGFRASTPEVVDITETGRRSSNSLRDRSGRFAATR